MADLVGIGAFAQAAGTAFTKLVDTVQTGVGGLLAPWQIRRLARAAAQAKAEKRKILLQGKIETDRLVLKAQHELDEYRRSLEQPSTAPQLPPPTADADEEVVIDVTWEPEELEIEKASSRQLPERARRRIEYQEVKRQVNIEQVIAHGFNELPPDAEVSSDPVDPDWVARFFDSVKDISQDHMQRLWGKLLAGEIASPGRFSLRTLDALRNMTSSEALLFERCCRLATDNSEVFVPQFKNTPRPQTLADRDYRRLVEAQLLHPGTEFMMGGFNGLNIKLPYHGFVLHVHSTPLRTFWSGIMYKLTLTGIQIGNLRRPPIDEAYLLAMRDSAREVGFSAELHDFRPTGRASTPTDSKNAHQEPTSEAGWNEHGADDKPAT